MEDFAIVSAFSIGNPRKWVRPCAICGYNIEPTFEGVELFYGYDIKRLEICCTHHEHRIFDHRKYVPWDMVYQTHMDS
jgi:phage terminase large subunit GpA-like protein